MAFLFWDASALSKNFTNETGHDTVVALLDNAAVSGHISTLWGYVEIHSILRRRCNGGLLDEKGFQKAVSVLQQDFRVNETFQILEINDDTMFSSIVLIDRHNLNSTDAVLLTALLNFARSPETPICVMVSADKRLLRAAEAEGLPALNPETALLAEAIVRIVAPA